MAIIAPDLAVIRFGQPFPQIDAPFTHHERDPEGNVTGDGLINQIWLQLLIQLWNRTGAAQGGSITDIENYSLSEESSASDVDARQNAELAALIQESVQVEIAKLGLDFAAQPQLDPLTALLFDSPPPASESSSPSSSDTSWVPTVDGSEPPVFITDGAGNLIFTAYTP